MNRHADPHEPIPFREVVKLRGIIPPRRSGSRLAVQTLYRWASRGIAGVRLRTMYAGGQPCTSVAALRQFFQDVAAAKMGQQPPTPAERRAAISRVEAECDAAGL